MKWNRHRSCLTALGVMIAMNAEAQTLGDAAPPSIKEDDRRAPVDWGYGPGVRPNNNMRIQYFFVGVDADAFAVAVIDGDEDVGHALGQGDALGHVGAPKRPRPRW